jgi:hypothetical protein
MASLEESLWTELKSDSQIAIKTGFDGQYAIYYDDVPDGKLGAADGMIVISKIAETEQTFLDYQTSFMQVTAISESKISAISLKDDIIRVLTRFSGNLGGKRIIKSTKKQNVSSLKADDSKSYMEITEFSFNHFGDNV